MTTYNETCTESMPVVGSVVTTSHRSCTDGVEFTEATPLTDSLIVTESLELDDSESDGLRIMLEELTEALVLQNDGTAYGMLLVMTITEAMPMTLVVDALRLVTGDVTEAMGLTDAQATTLHIDTIVTDAVGLVDGNIRSGTVYVSWVANADTFAVTRYEGQGIQSGVAFLDTFVGAGPEGVYELEGASDDGEDIDAYITFPRTDFGESRKKAVQYAYLAVRGGQELVIKVQTDNGDQYEYPCVPVDDGEFMNSRAVFGKGLKGRYYQFEIANVAGGGLDLDGMEVTPIAVKRRL